jgi:membrane protein implicated in regulation of membrane protease activity
MPPVVVCGGLGLTLIAAGWPLGEVLVFQGVTVLLLQVLAPLLAYRVVKKRFS